jgi:hypothetical protein
LTETIDDAGGRDPCAGRDDDDDDEFLGVVGADAGVPAALQPDSAAPAATSAATCLRITA